VLPGLDPPDHRGKLGDTRQDFSVIDQHRCVDVSVLPHQVAHARIEGQLLPLGVRDGHPAEELVGFGQGAQAAAIDAAAEAVEDTGQRRKAGAELGVLGFEPLNQCGPGRAHVPLTSRDSMPAS
jgi:hypothetical protein